MAKANTRNRGARTIRRGRFETIERKIEDSKSMDYSNWRARRVMGNIIAAGRMRLFGQKPFAFPAYCRFPYNSYEDK